VSFLCRIQIAVTVCSVAAGCVSQPIGPAVAVKPGRDKPLAVFLRDVQQRYDLAYLECMQAKPETSIQECRGRIAGSRGTASAGLRCAV
jgi:hypothetical protein